jgi:hypothetical protein
MPFQTIQKAADVVHPGDTVVVAPGIYYESVQLTRPGAPGKPVTFTADRIEKDRVIISGADADIRAGKVPWVLEDAGTRLYSLPLAHLPARVLHEEIELYPYQSLADLKAFWITKRGTFKPVPPCPGPQHGWAYENGRLYALTYKGLGLIHSMDTWWAAQAIEDKRWKPKEVLSTQLAANYGYVLSPAQGEKKPAA